jgi:hypothetical protein
LAHELTINYIKDLTDEEIIELAEGFNEGLVEEYNIVLSTYELDIEDDIKELETSYENEEITKDEYEAESVKLTTEKKQLKIDLDKMFEKLKSIVFEASFDKYLDEMQHTVSWLKDYGWWENGKPHPDAFKRGIVSIDEDSVVSDLASGQDLDYFSNNGEYWRQSVGNTFYYIIPTDVY